MLRVRWHSFFLLIALLDVVVIALSLELHRHTIESVERLINSTSRLDERSDWIERTGQYILEQNAPANDLFVSGDVAEEHVRFARARARLTAQLDRVATVDPGVSVLRRIVAEMTASADDVFENFRYAFSAGHDAGQRRASLIAATQAMSRMDAKQLEALRKLGMLAAVNVHERRTLLDEHEANLLDRVNYERYFIAAIAALLFGVLWFGYRLRKTGQALEVQRRALREERRERLAAIGELCSSVAHGIRNPLAAMRSSAQLSLELGQLDPDSRQRLEDILDEGRRLGDRVSGLLNIARVDTESFELLPLQDIVDSAIQEIDAEIRRRGLSVERDFGKAGVVIRGDRRQLAQVVIELLSNAMEHANDGGVIRVSCGCPQSNGLATIAVQNSGLAIPEELRSRIFDLFFTTKPSGTGIGLATVARIVRLHGGDVDWVSDDDGGTKFVVSLPVATAGTRRHRRGMKKTFGGLRQRR